MLINCFLSRDPRIVVFSLFLLLMITSCNEEDEAIVYESEINEWAYITELNGLSSDYINTIFEDSKGGIWIGTNFGLSLYSDNKITNYTAIDGLVDNNIYAISEDREGAIWVGSGRGLNVFIENKWYPVRYFYGASIYALEALQNEEGMLIGTGGYGIYRLDYATKGFSRYSYVEGCDACNSINSLFQATDGSVWVASFAGARKIRGSFITRFDVEDGLAGNIATTINEDSWGNIWVGTVEGKTISKISGNTVSQVSFNNGSGQNFIFGIQEDNRGNLWVGTVGNGLFRYDGAIMKKVEGAPNSTITALLKDKDGNIWVGTTESGVAIYITNPLH